MKIKMASNRYSDLIAYESFSIVINTCMIEYSNVTLLKHMCGKKPGTHVDKIVLNPANGSWNIYKSKFQSSPSPLLPEKKKSTFVEFKGVHTRFDDEGKAPALEDSTEDLEYVPNVVDSSTFKIFSGRNRVKNIDDDIFEEFSAYIKNLGSGSRDTIVINRTNDLVRVAGVNLEDRFEDKKRYKLPSGKYSVVRIF
jgi:hypothetical protein